MCALQLPDPASSLVQEAFCSLEELAQRDSEPRRPLQGSRGEESGEPIPKASQRTQCEFPLGLPPS